MSARFGEMLLTRRRERGMSIQQVSNAIKIRPQIIEYFETGNFASMPPRGYAQGMISSYARFLGLNPRAVVDAYFDELHTYERVNNTGAGRFQDSVAEASPHNVNPEGRFLMVNGPVPNSRYGQRPPQAGYVSESVSPHEPMSTSTLRYGQANRGGRQRALPQGGGYGPSGQSRYGQGPRPARGDQYPSRSGRSTDSRYRGSAPSAGRPRPQGSMQNGYRSASGRPGQQNPGRYQQSRGRSSQPPSPFSDNRVLMLLGAAVIIILLLLLLLFFKGCAPSSDASAQGSTQTSQSQSSTSSSNKDDDLDDDSADDGTDDAATTSSQDGSSTAASNTTSQQNEPTETKVKISIAKGKTSWLEIKLDGKSVYGDTVVGPFEQEYTVTQSMEITVDKPADVTITKNGEKVRYDSKSAGVARVTITAPQTDSTQDGTDADSTAQDADGTQDATQAATDQNTATGQQTTQSNGD
ncbi:helix-turn-helix domain-containing protein [Collinsella tanakaei]|uniref:helix-turn-helix domain-containing protein n=1 Tax=Collinsella tanakaei TaxID=626935 RepID=UPI00248D948A|nr:helix-turn-helix transcriptional regulator [Collinsella tanakaei]